MKKTAGSKSAKIKVSRRRSVAIDTVPLPEKVLGMPVKNGRITRQRNRYILTVGRKRVEVPVGAVISKAEINKLSGKEVKVAYSKTKPSTIVAIGSWPTPERPRLIRDWIVCYYPGPEILRRVQPHIRDYLINKYATEGIISTRLKGFLRESAR